MNSEIVEPAIKKSLAIAVLLSALLFFYSEKLEALAILVGASWGCANLYAIQKFLQQIFISSERRFWKFLGAFVLKFPLLYFIGYFFCAYANLSMLYLLMGFSTIILAFLLQSVSRLFRPTMVCFLFIGMSAPLLASLETDVPEVPNFFTLLYKMDKTAWTAFLHEWENVIFAGIAAVVISIVFCFGARRSDAIPSGLQNFLEAGAEKLRDFVREILGPPGDKYVPFLGTLFIYILIMNWMVLIPLMKAPSSSLNVTVALAICVFALVQYLSLKNWGVFGYLYHMAGSPKTILEWLLVPLMLPIEILTQLTRPLTLSFRLFGNVVGEDILIGAFALFGTSLFSHWEWPIGLPLQLPFMLLALLTSLMQALVFTLLSTIYILLSMPDIGEKAATKKENSSNSHRSSEGVPDSADRGHSG